MLVKASFLLAVTTNLLLGYAMPSKFELEGRIVGSKNTSIADAPYQVSVRFANKHLCGGSIISKRVVLTADHSIEYPLFARAYSIQYGVSEIGGNENVITAKRIVLQKDVDKSGYDYDVSLIFLVSDITFSAAAQPIPLASVAPAVGTYANITGWGFQSEKGTLAHTLQMASVQIMDRSICQEQYKTFTNISENMLCAGVVGGGVDACTFDSGGPLVSNGKLVGSISFGIGCGRADHYGIYTNIAAYKDWIDSQIN